MTLNGRYALCCRKDASFGAQHKNLNKDRPILGRSVTLVSGDIRFMRIYSRWFPLPWGCGVKRHWGCRQGVSGNIKFMRVSGPTPEEAKIDEYAVLYLNKLPWSTDPPVRRNTRILPAAVSLIYNGPDPSQKKLPWTRPIKVSDER